MKLKRVGNKLCRGATVLQTVECSCGGGPPTGEPIPGVDSNAPAETCCNGVFGWSPLPPDGLPSTRLVGFALIASSVESLDGTLFEGGNRSGFTLSRNLELSGTSSGCSAELASTQVFLASSGVTAPLTGTSDLFDIYVGMSCSMRTSLNIDEVVCSWATDWRYVAAGSPPPLFGFGNPLFGSPLHSVYPSTQMVGTDAGVSWTSPLPFSDSGRTVSGIRFASLRRSLGVVFGADVTWQDLRYSTPVPGEGNQQRDGATIGWQMNGMRLCTPPALLGPERPDDPRAILTPERAFQGGCCGQ